jgi:hypothetical protein
MAILVYQIYDKFHLKYIDDTDYMYYDDRFEKTPLKFLYKGHEIILKITSITMEQSISCYSLERVIYEINDKKVACLSKMECTFTTKRFMYFNPTYDTSEFYKILKVARKIYNKKLNEKFTDKLKSNEYKIY